MKLVRVVFTFCVFATVTSMTGCGCGSGNAPSNTPNNDGQKPENPKPSTPAPPEPDAPGGGKMK
jgi:hypothetical protein